MVEMKENGQAYLLAYTRTADPAAYPQGLAGSLHLAYSRDGEYFYPLHENYGILFVSGEISTEDTIVPKGMKNPWIFRLAEEGYGVLAVRVDGNGDRDDAMRGSVLFWTTADFVDFEEQKPLCLSGDSLVEAVQCRFHQEDGRYHILWKDEQGAVSETVLADLCGTENAQAVSVRLSGEQADGRWMEKKEPKGVCGAKAGFCIAVDRRFADHVKSRWSRIFNTELLVPESVHVSGPKELEGVGAVAVYSDGSTFQKKVDWDAAGIDFAKPGCYPISGKVKSPRYPFPLASGYGDPVLLMWEGSW
ncbi:MAG: Ig-like domain-containing protein, partial [Agathobacter sp.]|nr:Ig-like domain-containing protein [Agathobacter sp.]